jgi:hypothetical protein
LHGYIFRFHWLYCCGFDWCLLSKKTSPNFSGQGFDPTTTHKLGDGELPTVNYFDYGDMRFLHLGSPAVQGSMKLSKPFDIHLEYQQRMMAWLLFVDLAKSQPTPFHATRIKRRIAHQVLPFKFRYANHGY